MTPCYHCGDSCERQELHFDHKIFCCQGCITVYDILDKNNLNYYYELEKNPGISPVDVAGKYDFLENSLIKDKLLEFDDGHTQIVTFLIPSMHCSSCIWVLENLQKLNKGVRTSQVDFPKKLVRITFVSEELGLKDLVLLLVKLGYEPYISMENMDKKNPDINRTLVYQLGIAGFAFGNVMFLSFPEYFQVQEYWLDRFGPLFRWLMFAFSVPVVFYSAKDYFISAFKGLRAHILNIDVPIALGISVLFFRSTLDIIMNWGTGFFDSLTGLVFFLLVGKYFQQKTYAYLSFERDYKSYFPIAITRISEELKEEQVPVYEIEEGDRLILRNEELLPVDAILLKGHALIDYSFVTGEAVPVYKYPGDKLFAGGRQKGGIIEVEVIKKVEQSYLTQLWSNKVFTTHKQHRFQSLTNKISKHFTAAVLSIALLSGLFWLIFDISKVFQVITAVLIVACPCAIALAGPFTLGNLLRYFGRHKFYLKEAYIIEQMAQIDMVVFDKTGTLTTHKNAGISYEGNPLEQDELMLLGSSLRASNHPLSRALYDILDKNNNTTLDSFEEVAGEGIAARYKAQSIKIGSSSFVEAPRFGNELNRTSVYISSNDSYKGRFVFQNNYREGIVEVFQELGKEMDLIILSGDNDSERSKLEKLLPKDSQMHFHQKPDDKLEFIKQLQANGRKVMMVGDGLNDAGALAQSDMGVSIAENVNVFSPACDGILDATSFDRLADFFKLSKKGTQLIKWSFVLSFFYNVIGLGFAVSGHLSPVVAAILMPLSSISVVVFTTISTYYYANRIFKK